MNDQRTIDLITECRDALAAELGAWDIDPPLHHVKAAHDKCVAWLDDHAQQTEPVAESHKRATETNSGQSMTQADDSGNASY